ncbi:MAG: DUF1116 domain-containing protein [Saccharofermentanales bacterium]|jgi:hypothetical protein|nr:DUF1116 domain-containing protein [Eubacteriales bacterium]MDD3611636.1 DUF1116 domain-containing protein [Eubacteriales bacterium]
MQFIEDANKKALEIIQNAQPTLVGMGIARDTVPGMHDKLVLHAGPPITWEKMSGPLRGAVVGGLIYEGLASNPDEAAELAASGEIEYSPCHHHDAVGPMAGVVTASMPVFIVENKSEGNFAYCTMNEGLGKVLRFGAYEQSVIDHLKWMEKTLYPIMKEALEIYGPMDIKNLMAQSVQMGDECHNRNKATTSLFIREIVSSILQTDSSKEDQIKVIDFLNSNDHFTLNLSMPAAKASLEPVGKVENSTIVYTMCRNGTEFGIRVAALGDRWFTAPAEIIDGLYFPGYSMEDANPDIGDSSITETLGLGGFSMATAPAIVQFVGGTPQDAINYTTQMYEITTEESGSYKLPPMNFRGSPTGIDIRKVVDTQILPVINSGIAHKDAGVGQVGAGVVNPPMKCFEDALEAYVALLEKEGMLE